MKKVVIADNVAFIVNKTFALEESSFALVWVGAFAFGVQVLADFSAYTDIARGSARLLGFRLSKNFDHPYISASPTEFWKRWHISLSSWIHDYVFLPLALSRRLRTVKFGIIIAVSITFFLNGLWHGAGWNFIGWGIYQLGLILIYGWAKSVTPEGVRESPWLRPFQILLMFVLTHLGYIIFREWELAYTWRNLTFSPFEGSELQMQTALFLFGQTLFYALPLWGHTLLAYVRDRFFVGDRWQVTAFQTLASLVMFLSILVFRGDSVDFIYFQF